MKKLIFLLSLTLLVITSCSNEKINEEEENFPTVRVAHQGILVTGGYHSFGEPSDLTNEVHSPPLHYTFGTEGGGVILVADEWYWSSLWLSVAGEWRSVVYERAAGDNQGFIVKANYGDWLEVRMITSQKVVVRVNPNTGQFEREEIEISLSNLAPGSPQKGKFAIIEVTQFAE